MAPIPGPDQGRSQAVLAANALFVILPLPFVVMRLWARRLSQFGLKLNDYLITIALFFSLALSIMMMIGTIQGGMGQHIANVSADEIVVNLKITFVATLLWPSANTFVRLSVLHFFKSTFPSRKTVISIYVVAALAVVFWLGTLATALGICVPLDFYWNRYIHGRCDSGMWYWYLSTAAINLLLNVVVIILPLPCVWKLQMQTSQKVFLTLMYIFGGIICMVSILQGASLWSYQTTDFTYNQVLNVIPLTLEPTLGIITACLPTLPPILTRVRHSAVATRIGRASEKMTQGMKRDGDWGKLKKLSGVRFSFQMHGLKAHDSPVAVDVDMMNDSHSMIGQAV